MTDATYQNSDLIYTIIAIRELVGGNEAAMANVSTTDPLTNETVIEKVFQVTCGDKGFWVVPADEDWPTCQLLPNKHCSVKQDLNNTIPDGFKLKDSAVSSVLNTESLSFTCATDGHRAVLSSGVRVAEFSLLCDDNGKFVETWPTSCEPYEDCVLASFPDPLKVKLF